MAIEIGLEGKIEEDDKDPFLDYLRHLAKHKFCKVNEYENILQLEVCPEGYIECSFDQDYVNLVAQSEVAGPGFHAYVAKLYDEIIEECKIEFSVIDATNYYFDRNFKKLNEQFFYRWIESIASLIKEKKVATKDWCLAWPKDYYRPLKKENTLITPMGYFGFDEFNKDPKELAPRFFIWNHLEKDALYYRNCAIHYLWKECYFEYSKMNEESDKYAHQIIDLLELAHEKDPKLALPLSLYNLLCDTMDCEKILHDVEDYEIKDIGYRRHDVIYNFGNWCIQAPGTCDADIDETTGAYVLIAPYKSEDESWSWIMRSTAYTFNKTITSFIELFEEKDQKVMDTFAFEENGVAVKGNLSQYEGYVAIEAQCNHDCEMMLVSISIRDLSFKEQAISMIRNIRWEAK
ncbi:MAG: hypothetical protein RR520_01500 [Erysipelotrichaceae bacterium]